jgi:2,4-dienoyl-CoA reductase-like NADH-dependent reductase (Old Yellow Enzyme family)
MIINNRITGQLHGPAADETGVCSPLFIEYLKSLAKGGWGLIITGHVRQKNGQAGPWQLGINNDSVRPD